MLNTPLIAFTFAHERSETNPPVRNLLKEQLQVTSLVSPLVQQKYCETQALVNVGADRLNELIDREGDRLIGLHYASDVATLLRAREGKGKSVERALRGKLGRKLGALPHLKWVFLSGDGSQEQAESLLRAGVPLVIRSQNMINDDAAFRFAYFFYQAVGQGITLGQACEKATSEVRRDYVNKAKLTYEHEPPSGYGSDWPFAYHVNTQLGSPMHWSVHNARGQAGAGLPRLEEAPLPPTPFTDFAPLTEEYSLCVVGRDREARHLYEAANAPQGPAVIVVSGGDQVGKTSFLRARVTPLLNKQFHVRYASFEQDALTTLSKALMSEEDLSLVRTWVELEGGRERVMLQPQMITELMNEAQSSFRSHYRAERADFSQFLRVIRAMWVRDELGEGDNLLMRLGMLFDQQSKANQEEEESGGDIRPLAVILDQFEQSFSALDSLEQRRQDRFWETIKQLCYNPDRPFRGRLILCVNERESSTLTQLLHEKSLPFEHVHLSPLSREELMGYLHQLREQPQLREHFPLMIDERTPTAWSLLLDQTPPAELGYRFHSMLRHLWITQSQRPLLVSVELLNQELGERSSLSDLLLVRVELFISLMRAQGDEDLNEQFALDLLYHMAKATRDQRARQGDRGPTPTIEVGDFLSDYLQWNVELPEPWSTRQRSLGDQSLWVITQAIDLGLFRGRLTAGTSLPSGSISMIHPRLYEVLEREWSARLGSFSRAIQRLVDYIQTSLSPSPEDVKLALEAFKSTRLPTSEEADVLSRSVARLKDQESRAHVSGRRDKLLVLTLGLVLMFSIGRCAQLGESLDEVTVQQDHTSDQVRLLAADQAHRDGHPHDAAALLNEIRRPQLGSKWEELTLSSLNTPLVTQRVIGDDSWRRAEITPRSLLVERADQRKALWSGRPLTLTHDLGAPTHIDHDEDGQHWASFESGVLFFWSLNKPQATQQRLAVNAIKSLHLNHEGTIAAVLKNEGTVSLHRSYNYPIKEFGGLRGARVIRASLSPDREQLLLIDERDGLQTISLADERVSLSVEPLPGMQLSQSVWIKSTPPSILAMHTSPRGEGSRLTWHQRGREPLLIHQGSEEVRQLFHSPYAAQIGLEVNGAKARQRVLKLIDLTNPQRVSSMITPPISSISALSFDPTGARLVIASVSGEQQKLQLFSLRERTPALNLAIAQHLPSVISMSDDGQSVFGMSPEGVSEWNAYDGRLMRRYQYAKLSPIAMSHLGAQLKVVFADQRHHQRSTLLTWPLNEPLLSAPVSTRREEISEAAWYEDELITGNQRGEITMWSAHQQITPKVKFKGHQDRVSVIRVDPDQESFVSGAEDGSVARWSLRDGRALARYDGHKAPVTAIALSTDADLKQIVTGDRRGMLRYQSSQMPSAQSWRGHGSWVEQLVFAPTGDLLVSTTTARDEREASGVVWKLNDGAPQQVMTLPRGSVGVAWDSRGERPELIGVTRSGEVWSWRERGGAPKELGNLRESLNGAKLTSAHFSPDGSWFVGITSQGRGVLYQRSRARAQVITIPQGKLTIARFLSLPNEARRDGALPALALGNSLGKLWIWRAGSLMLLGDHQGPLNRLTISPKDGSISSSSETRSLRWQGPFKLDSLAERLQRRARLCVSPSERIALLAESPEEARASYGECVKRR